jgi:HSP20 family protein
MQRPDVVAAKKEAIMELKNLIPRSRSVLVKREEADPFAIMRRRMDHMFEGLLQGFDLQPFESQSGVFNPNIDVVENDKEIRISAELPGMEDKDIEVSINKESLSIKGEKKEEREDKGKGYYRMERSYGSFSRTIPLPIEVETDKIEAKFKKGVLSITLPKTARAVSETKKITVKAE